MKTFKLISSFLAIAIVLQYGDGNSVPPNYLLRVELMYVGSDVPGTIWRITTNLSIVNTITAATLQAALATAIRTDATSRGLTVGANNVWMPAWTTQ